MRCVRPARLWRPPAILLFLCLIVFAAGPAPADPRDHARLAIIAPSERLQLHVLGRALETPRPPLRFSRAMRHGLERTGFYHEGPRPALIAVETRFSPLLGWDANLNGGYFNGRFELQGLIFEVEPERVAKAGLVGGATLGSDLRLAYGPGRYLELRTAAEAVWSPQHRLGRADAALTLCSRNHLRGWTFADVCAGASRGWRELSTSSATSASATLTTLFAGPAAHHEITGGLARYGRSAGTQRALTLSWGAVWQRVTTHLSLTLLEPIPGETATRQRLSADLRWLWGGQPVSLGLRHARSAGGMILGIPREDRLTGLSLTFRPRPRVTVELNHHVNRSSFALFNDRRTGINVHLQLRR